MANKKKHLLNEEKFLIEKMTKNSSTISDIAKLLGRGKSTVSAEIKRNGGRLGYSRELSNANAVIKQKNKKKQFNKVLNSKKIKRLVDKALDQNVSPEKISDFLRGRRDKEYVSAKSIRKYIKYKRNI